MRTPEPEPLSKADRKALWQRIHYGERRRWKERHDQYRAELGAAKAAWLKSRMDWLAWIRIKDEIKSDQREREAFWIGYDALTREGLWQDTQAMREQAYKLGIQEIARRYCERLMRRGK